MNPSVIYKLAFAQDPTSAVAHAAAAVGLPRGIVKLALPLTAMGRAGLRTARRQLLRGAERTVGRGTRGLARQARRAAPRMERSALYRSSEQIAREPWNRPQPPPIPKRELPMLGPEHFEEVPGLGRRLMKNWWTLPVGAAGVYGLGKLIGQGEDMVSAFSGSPQMGFGYPESPSPAQGRYQQMMALARQYGYM